MVRRMAVRSEVRSLRQIRNRYVFAYQTMTVDPVRKKVRMELRIAQIRNPNRYADRYAAKTHYLVAHYLSFPNAGTAQLGADAPSQIAPAIPAM